MTRKVKSISFNLDDPFELEMYEHSKRFSSFSAFVKRLIHISLNGHSENLLPKKIVHSIKKVPMEQVEIDQENLRQLI